MSSAEFAERVVQINAYMRTANMHVMICCSLTLSFAAVESTAEQ